MQSQRLAQYDDTISGFEKHLLGQPVRAWLSLEKKKVYNQNAEP